MNPRISLINRQSGKLTVVKQVGKNQWGNSLWHCECKCGGSKVVLYQHLVSKATTSCGCIKRGGKKKLKP